MTQALSHAEQVLAYWHKIEFFAAADLKGVQSEGNGCIRYSSDELASAANCLPWLNREQIRRAGIDYRPEADYRFKLYLGLFKCQDIFEVARGAYPDLNEEWAERNRDQGLTCSFSVLVDEYGQIDRSSVELSTVPWVMGALQGQRLAEVSRKAFNLAKGRFCERLETILTVADNLKREHGLPLMLTTAELIEMLKAMSECTSFQPLDESPPAVAVQVLDSRLNQAEIRQWQGQIRQTAVFAQAWQDFDLALAAPETAGAGEEGAPKEAGTSAMQSIKEVTILNSFFIDDLEIVMDDIAAKGLREDSPLACYLQGHCERQADLLTTEGQSVMQAGLSMPRMPVGRWPGENSHSMSLMQQFAINTIDEQLDTAGLYSVNGPPGTGKTTMLRHLVARNVVKRAEVLASLGSAEAAFAENLKVNRDGQAKTIKTLIPELVGYEMVVVSSNNAAVENITQELPQCMALGEVFNGLSYLRPVARKLAVEPESTEDGTSKRRPLEPENDCWGLIATALGKSANRSRFVTRVFYNKIDNFQTEGDASSYRTLIPALKELATGRDTAKDFKQAQREFKAAEAKVALMLEELERLQGLKRLEGEVRSRQEAHEASCTQAAWLRFCESKQRARPRALWPIKRFLRYRAVLRRLQGRKEQAESAVELARQRAESLERRYANECCECEPFRQRYIDALLPDQMLDLESPAVQRTSFGHCEVLNEARAQVTARAFELHQAWLVDVYQQKLLGDTLFSLAPMINGKIGDREVEKAIWQMLFMIVPVVSSTFASVATQFKGLRAGELGWLFVDEAGQASPQQAVGALWRAKRAVVVGDPLQIEPVFTVPPGLVEAMAKGEFGRDWYKWSPTVTSVQLVADQVNPYGTALIADDFWVGSPLRVHRRCQEPMFSLANTIAYNNKMIHGSDELSPGYGDSRWFDVTGDTQGKHFVPEQAKQVAEMLQKHIDKQVEEPRLPSVYIISPFKAVAEGVKIELERALPAAPFGGKKKLKQWLQGRVGTVHTFQGKEEDNVILVLGLSEESPGAAEWASSKPNLLNVALTRAKKRIYVVGSTNIWSSKQYFSDVSHELPIASSHSRNKRIPEA